MYLRFCRQRVVLQSVHLIVEFYYENYNCPSDVAFHAANNVFRLSSKGHLHCNLIYSYYNQAYSESMYNVLIVFFHIKILMV